MYRFEGENLASQGWQRVGRSSGGDSFASHFILQTSFRDFTNVQLAPDGRASCGRELRNIISDRNRPQTLQNDGHAAHKINRLYSGAPIFPVCVNDEIRSCAAGPLCVARHRAGADRRRDSAFASFRAFNRSLQWECAAAPPAELAVAPNASWPDVVYYNSFTHDGQCPLPLVTARGPFRLARS